MNAAERVVVGAVLAAVWSGAAVRPAWSQYGAGVWWAGEAGGASAGEAGAGSAADTTAASVWFPDARHFRGPIADPREPRFAVGLAWTDLFDGSAPSRERPPFEFPDPAEMSVDVHGLANLGGTLPIWRTVREPDAGLLVGVQAGVFARFRMREPSRDAVGTDWMVAIPVEVERGAVAWRLRLLHRSSHLGDELIESTGARRIEFAHEAVDVLIARRIGGIARAYAGGAFIFRSNTEGEEVLRRAGGSDRLAARLGAELLTWPWADGRVGVVAAVDAQVAQRTDWASALSAVAGLTARGEARSLRVVGRYFRGPSPMGEFFLTRERLWGVEVVVGL